MEQLLVQRIALGWWRQQRLIRAETAGIELSRRMELHDNRWRVKSALGLGIEQEIAPGHLEPLTEDDEAIADDCRKIVNEYVRLDPEVIENNDLKTLTVAAPFLFQSLEFHAEGQTVPEFLALRKGGLAAWVQKEVEGRRSELYTRLAHKRVAAVVELVKSSRSMPVDMDLISRYQTSLDNDLYKAARALREAQEHRLKVIQGTASEIEGAAGSFGNIGG